MTFQPAWLTVFVQKMNVRSKATLILIVWVIKCWDTLQNVFFSVLQNKVSQKGLTRHEGKFLVSYFGWTLLYIQSTNYYGCETQQSHIKDIDSVNTSVNIAVNSKKINNKAIFLHDLLLLHCILGTVVLLTAPQTQLNRAIALGGVK